jgi:hypothetical protein
VIHYSALNTHVVVLNTLEDVVEIMDRRSANYSNRPSTPVFDLYDHDSLNFLRLMRLIILG